MLDLHLSFLLVSWLLLILLGPESDSVDAGPWEGLLHSPATFLPVFPYPFVFFLPSPSLFPSFFPSLFVYFSLSFFLPLFSSNF